MNETCKLFASLLCIIAACCSSGGVNASQRQLMKSCSTIAQIAGDADLTVFMKAAELAHISGSFSNPDWAYTVLAPVDEAFEDAAAGLNITLLELISSPDLPDILNNHLLAYPLTVEELIVAGTVHTQFNFDPLTITAEAVDDDQLIEISSPINTAHVIKDDIEACKSFVHIIDAVLLPEL